jgi:hypothetical protein
MSQRFLDGALVTTPRDCSTEHMSVSEPPGQAEGNGLTAAIRRWQQRRRIRRNRRIEAEHASNQAFRNFDKWTGTSGGSMPGG